MRITLAILIAFAAFGVSLACAFILGGTFEGVEIDFSILATGLLLILAIPFILLAGGVVAAPKVGLRSYILDKARGHAQPIAGQWVSTVFIGLVVCLLAVLASGAIQALSPQSFSTEKHWHDTTVADGIQLAAELLATALLCWIGLLNILAWICLKVFGEARRTFALAAAIFVIEGLGLGLIALLSPYLDYPFDLAVAADILAWSVATIVCAWLYVTRTLEHGLLALMWFPALIVALRPLWDYLGV